MTEKRPFGVSVLAGAAFLASASLALALLFGVRAFVLAIREENGAAVFALLVMEFCFIALAWIFAATGRDLLSLRKRGRTLALIFLCILGLIGVATAAAGLHELLLWLGIAIFALSIGAMIYLFRPSIRCKFTTDAALPWLPTPSNTRLLVAATSLASAACLIAAECIGLWSSYDWFESLAVLSILWLPYIFIPFRLRGNRIKSGLTLAIAMGSTLFVPGIVFLYYLHEWERSGWTQGIFLLGLLLQPILVAAALRAYRSLPSKAGDRRKATVSYAYGAFLFGLFWFEAIYGNFHGPIAYNEEQAMESMGRVYMTASQYATAHQGFFPDTPTDSAPDEKAECANDRPRMYDHDKNDGYIISYEAISADKLVAGYRVAASYIATARPVTYRKTGYRSFFVDKAHIIRFTSENRAATDRDPELPAGSVPPL